MGNEDTNGGGSYKEWSYGEVKLFCEGMEKFGGDLGKVRSTLEKTRSMKDVVDFYYRIYPYCQENGIDGLLRVYEARDAVSMMGTFETDNETQEEERRDLIFKLLKMEKKLDELQHDYSEHNYSGVSREDFTTLPHYFTDY